MHAEILAIGDELTSGQRVDTNSAWLSERLGDLGVRVMFHTTVGDELETGVEAFRVAAGRADLVVATGGLGPTADDLTREAIAKAAGVELLLDAGVLAHIRGLFQRRGRGMPERNQVQAMFPAGSQVVPNPNGTAPGIDFRFARAGRSPSRIFALPGVPAEMKEMWEASVAPAVAAMLGSGRRVIRHHRIKCFGVGESDLEQMLPDLIRRGRSPSVGITVHKATITLRVSAEGESEDHCRELMSPTLATIRECVGELMFGEEDDELEHAVIRGLRRRSGTLSVLEWGTGGLVSHWLSAADPAGRSFVGGIVVRRAASVAAALSEFAEEDEFDAGTLGRLAALCRERFAADFALALGPLPAESTPAADQSRFAFAVADAGSVAADSSRYAGHPDIVLERAAKQGLDLLRKRIGSATMG